MCTLHAMSKRGPHKHIAGMQCSILMVPYVIVYTLECISSVQAPKMLQAPIKINHVLSYL